MSTWDDVKKKIQDMEGNPLADADMLRTMDTISIADYWRRRFEEEHSLWERRLAAKDEEMGQIQERTGQNAQELQMLRLQLDAARAQLSDREHFWEEKNRALEMRCNGLQDRMDWEARTRLLEEQNRMLLGQAKRRSEDGGEDAGPRRERAEDREAKSRAEREIQELRAKLDLLQDERTKWDQERARLSAAAAEAKELKAAKESLESRLRGAEAELGKLSDEHFRAREEAAPLSDALQKMALLMERREKDHLLLMEDLGRGFAHRVRNFLAIMSGTLQLCEANYKMEDELKQQINLVDQNAQEMLKTIEEFLSLVRIPEMNLEVVDLNEFLGRALAALEEKIKAGGVNVSWKKSDAKPLARVDARLLAEAVDSLVANALEAMPDGGKLAVEVIVKPEEGAVGAVFQDSGKGISDAHIRKVFQPYFTTKKGHKGLGMSVANRVMELHRGSLGVSSVKGEGTKISMTFPLAQPDGEPGKK